MKNLATILLILFTVFGFSQNIDLKDTRKHYQVIDGEIVTDSHNKNDPNGLETALKHLAITKGRKALVTVTGGYEIDLGDYVLMHRDSIIKPFEIYLNGKSLNYKENLDKEIAIEVFLDSINVLKIKTLD